MCVLSTDRYADTAIFVDTKLTQKLCNLPVVTDASDNEFVAYTTTQYVYSAVREVQTQM